MIKPGVSEAFKKLTRSSQWEQTAAIPLQFSSGHPQGMVKIGGYFYISSVEITKPTTLFPEFRDGYDRDTGEGIGFLCKIDGKGNLLERITLGEGSIYHTGGIDYDGTHIWVPAAEYRPNSKSILYRVGISPLKAEKAFTYSDHIGGIIHNTDDHVLHGISWGARRFYRWPINKNGSIEGTNIPRNQLMKLNREFYIDYQDCHYIGRGEMLCSGLNTYNCNGTKFGFGGIDLICLKTYTPIHQIPVELWSPKTGRPMTNNPFWMEEQDGIITAYFIPDDDDSEMYVFKVIP